MVGRRLDSSTAAFGLRVLEAGALAVFVASMAVIPLLQGARSGDTLFLFRLLAFVPLVMTLGAVAWRGRVSIGSMVTWAAFLAYVALIAVSALVSPYEFGAEQSFLDSLASASGFILAAVLVRTRRARTLALGTFFVGAGVVAGYGLLQAFGSALVPAPNEARVSSLFTNPNHFAGLLDLAAPMALGIALFARKARVRLAFLALAVPLYVALGFTYSYGGWLATGVASVILIGVWIADGLLRRRTLVPLWIGLLLLIVAVGAALTFISTSPRLRGDTVERVRRLADLDSLSSLVSRMAVQRAGLEMSLDHPWLGVGPGNFTTAIVGYRPEEVDGPEDAYLHQTLLHALSDYLNVATESGIPALVAFSLFWLMALVRAPIGSRPLRAGITAALGAILIHGLFDGNLTYVPTNAFLAFALVGLMHAGFDSERGIDSGTARSAPGE